MDVKRHLSFVFFILLFLPQASSVNWPVDGGDGQRRWYKQTFYDTSGNENASTHNLGCTINRFYIHDNTVYAECGDTIHKIQLTYPNLTYQGNFSIGAGEDMKGILQGKVITSAGKAYDTNGSLLWTAGNITYNKWNGTQYVQQNYGHTPTLTKAVTENHVYTADHYAYGYEALRVYDLSGNGIGLLWCGVAGYSTGGRWNSIADDGNYMVAKCYTYHPYGSQNWHSIGTYDLDYTLYDRGVTCNPPGPYYNWGGLFHGATNQSLISCTPTTDAGAAFDPNLMLGSTNKYQFYGIWNTWYSYPYTFISNEPDARNYLNLNQTIDNATNYEARACYDEANWYETSGTNLTKWTVPRTTPVWSVKVGTALGPGKPICLENVILAVNASGTVFAINKQTGATENKISGFTANQFIVGGDDNTIISAAGTKIYYSTLTNPDLTLNSSEITFTPVKPVEGDVITINAVVYNIGHANASDVVVRFLDNSSIIGLTQIFVDRGSNTTTSVNWSTVVGVHNITVVVDPEDNISESNESNNNASKEITVKPKPDTPTSDRAFILAPYYWQGYVEHSEDLVNELRDIGYDVSYLKNYDTTLPINETIPIRIIQIDIPTLYDLLNSDFGILHITSHGDPHCIAIESFENVTLRDQRRDYLLDTYGYLPTALWIGEDPTSKKPFIGVCGDFIRNLTINKFTNPLVYFEACDMGVNNDMTNAFLGKDVGAYVGYDRDVAICTSFSLGCVLPWGRPASESTNDFYNYLYSDKTVGYATSNTRPSHGEGCDHFLSSPCVYLVNHSNPDLKILRQTSSKKTGTLHAGETATHDVLIDPSVTQATFKVTWPGSDLDLVLYAPNGSLIDPPVAMDSPDIDYVEGDTYEYYTVRDPESGNWSMKITAVDAPSGGEEYTAKADIIAHVILRVSTDQRRYDPNDSITITAFLQDGNTPLTGASVTAEIEMPDGAVNVTLFDDGSHGDTQAEDGVYVNTYADTSTEGIYLIKVTASGATPEQFIREASRTVEVRYVPDIAINMEDINLSKENPLEGDVVTVNATVHNIGGTNASAVMVQFYVLDAGGNATQIGLNKTIDYLDVGENETVQVDWEPSAGNYSIYVLADPYDSIKEENESNNYASVNISVLPDSDRDRVTDSFDNCPFTPNPDQLDSDLDSAGDACDPDDDNDGILDEDDNCPLDANPDQSDFDGDNLGDACDLDDDNDYDPDETDCEPRNPLVHHNATEVCNNIDDNCNSLVDENLIMECGFGVCMGASTCSAGVWGECSTKDKDAGVCAICDADGIPIYDETQESDCGPTLCPPDGCGVDLCGEHVFGDYSESIPNECSAIHTCTQKSCAGTAVCEVDNDNDGYSVSCGDCNDLNPQINPAVTELCNNVDDNCDGRVDEGCPKTLKQDSIELLENAKDGELCSRWKNIGGGCHDKELDKVINYIKKSLEQSYWDSEVEVNSKKVFDYEMLAVTHCLRGPFKNLDPACGEAAGNLVEADRVIANTTLETAKSLIVQNPKNQKCFDQETKKAELFYDEATNKISRKYQSLAILNYRLSWEHSQKATEYATTNRRTCGGWS